MISCSTPGASNANTSSLGVVQNHVYTVLGVDTLSDGTRLYRIRNPWGRESYTGDWNDDSSQWNQAFIDEVGVYVNEEDGIFFIDHQTLWEEFYTTQIHIDTRDLTQAFYLVTDDDTDIKPTLSTDPFCSGINNCQSSKHTFTVTTPVTQMIYLNAHTWPDRTYPVECLNSGNVQEGFVLTHTLSYKDKSTGANSVSYPNGGVTFYWNQHRGIDGF